MLRVAANFSSSSLTVEMAPIKPSPTFTASSPSYFSTNGSDGLTVWDTYGVGVDGVTDVITGMTKSAEGAIAVAEGVIGVT